MKKYLLLFCLCAFAVFSRLNAQDTLVFKNDSRITCKVLKIAAPVVEYVKWDNLNGPTYTIDQSQLKKIVYKNGLIETFEEESAVSPLIKTNPRTQAIKVDLFAPAFHKITLGYEYALPSGLAFEAYAGVISYRIFPVKNSNYYNNYTHATQRIQGGHGKIGIKFNMPVNQHWSGNKNLVPLQGFFLKLDLHYSNVNVSHLFREYPHEYPLTYPYTIVPTYETGSLGVQQYGMTFNMGYQVVVARCLTFGFDLGLGYIGTSEKFNISQMYYGYNADILYGYRNYTPGEFQTGAFTNVLDYRDLSPLCITGNITMGFAFGK